MKELLLAVVLATVAMAGRDPHVTESLVADINSKGLTWRASTKQGPRINGATTQQIKSLCGVKRSAQRTLPKRVFTQQELDMKLPAEFESAAKWPHCPSITHIRDQSECGSCWAVAAAGAISDRYCTLGGVNRSISAANIMECCSSCGNGCNGGDPGSAWQYWLSNGYATDVCQPYPFPRCEHHIPQNHYPVCPSQPYNTPQCTSTCSNASVPLTLYTGNTSYTLSGEDEFKRELLSSGPFEVSFTVYGDFPAYKTGVYSQQNSTMLGGHAVRLVGWGMLNGVAYWKIANSWNEDWGMNGYFLIQRGVDMCGIEDYGAAGAPPI